jgi:hypothetical protein
MTYRRDSLQDLDLDLENHWKITYLPVKKTSTVYKNCLLVLLLVFIVVFSFDSTASQCGKIDSTWESNGETFQTYTLNNDLPCLDTALITGVEYAVLLERSSSTQGLEELLVTLFAFDSEVFAIVELALILAFLTSHFAGRIVRWLGKT